MASTSNEKRNTVRIAQELTCICCGEHFIFGIDEQDTFKQRGWSIPKRCPSCRKEKRVERDKVAEEKESRVWQQKKVEETKKFEALLENWSVIPIDAIQPKDNHVLYIIGNGFDLMHGVKSSYYAFRDSLGKQNSLRTTLETFLLSEDIWADFESSLAKFNISSMGSQFMVDSWLDWMDAYDDDAGVAEFYLAIEYAANPIQIVAQELPRRFRMWVESLSVGTKDRPLKELIKNGKVLCFNYTEFIETLYGIPEQNICYIHGCRRKRKYAPKETLILGHMPGASDDAFDFDDNSCLHAKDFHKQSMIESAQDQVLQLIAEYDEGLTKNCREIIKSHVSFFSQLNEIETIVVIGHSLSPVDWDYFAEVAANLSNSNDVRWYFGCHSLRDLQNLEQMLKMLNIKISTVSVFRTDEISVTFMEDEKVKSQTDNLPKEKMRCISPDNKWVVKTIGNQLFVINQNQQVIDYKVQFISGISRAFFFPSGEYLAAIVGGLHSGVFLFRLNDDHWQFVNELEAIQNQSLLNSRLRHVFLTEQDISFVYNSRVRIYSLLNGALIANQPRRNAPSYSYEGKDIGVQFLSR